ncbi:Golgi to ER traffic protein 4 homolog isoform X3 [Ursus maritimus]|uniref:Golgi to ER traffic protein 4 homolog isoform X3 n=1 Tax=Ursus maritimus TaxID=29073 RepID=A0A8M1G6X8_URSMA|nr:Golgi to ER traffic protein 4 homolog isoform X3 [Ursus maritimus]XP_040490564.1 Golgi to ER traffic protein 4 homolog isoform X3 [Ursus maritimus]XP_040490565.1 Golgi to ER traffic protein 4 homolog isoform X3 [Ursus maritimus]
MGRALRVAHRPRCSERWSLALHQTEESRVLSRLVYLLGSHCSMFLSAVEETEKCAQGGKVRYMSQSKHTEARELMCSGALLFFSHGQQNSAADLSMLVLESLEKAEVEVADELLENLAKLFSLMDPNSPERVAFVSRALKWSSGGSGKLGHPRLHQLLALTLWKEQNYCESRYHFLHSADGEGCAHMLVEYSTSRGFRSEVDMFVAQAVLQFLCLKNKSSASVVFTTYTQKHPSIENGPPFVQPLLNFIWFLLLAVDGRAPLCSCFRGKLTVFTVLCEQYQPSLRRDPMYNEYLDRIGQLFFGVPPKQTSSYGGLLGKAGAGAPAGREQSGHGHVHPGLSPGPCRAWLWRSVGPVSLAALEVHL